MAVGRIKGITIEIGGDTSKLVKALSSVDNAIRNTQTNLRDINKALAFDPSNTALLKDKQVELSNAISDTKSKLEMEKQALEQMKSTEGFDANSQAARNLQTQIDLDTAALKQLEAQAKQASSILGTQMQIAGQKIQEVGNKIKSVGDKLAGFGQTMTTYVTTPIATGFGVAIKTAGDFDAAMSQVQAVSGATASEVEILRQKAQEMGQTTKFSASEAAEGLNYMAMAGWKTEDMLGGLDGVMNLAAASGEELGTTSDIVTDALTAFGMSADESSHFADILASAASNANTNVSMMGESFKYAAAPAGALGYSAEDVAIALGLMANSGIKADMAGTSLRNMFLRMAKPTKESQAAMDRLGISLSDGQGNMHSFRQIMEQLRESFQNINMTAEEYDSILSNIETQLQNGEMTQKQYNNSLEELNKQAFGAEGAEKARAAAMLGGTRAMSGLLAIANATEADYKKLTNAIDNSSQVFAKLADGSVVPLNKALESGQEIIEEYSGSAEAMAAVMLDNLPGQITLLKSNLEALAISIGNLLMPYVREFIATVQDWVTAFNEMDDAEKMQIIKMAALAAAIGPVLLIVGKFTSAIGSIVSAIGGAVSGIGTLISSAGGLSGVLAALSGPVGIVVAAVVALAAGFAYLFTTNEQFRNSIMQMVTVLQNNLKAAIESIKPALDNLVAAFNGLMTVLAPVFEMIFQYIVALISAIIAAIEPIVQVITNIITFITAIIEAFFALLQGDFQGFYEAINTAFNAWINGMLNFINIFIQAALAFFNTFGVNLKTLFTTIWTNVKTIITTKIEQIKTAIQTKWTAIKDWITETLQNILDKFKEIFEKIKEAVSKKITEVKESIVEGLEDACDYISDLPGRFYDWGVDMIQGLIDGVKSMIGGLISAAEEVAGTIASYIHFSEPDVGPLSNFHTFMPDMIDEMVRGINNGIPRLEGAMAGMTGSMAQQMQGSNNVTATNNVSINVYGAQGQNVQELANEIEQIISNNVVRRGVAFG